ncbi:hypothetical protein JB92DRAFT_2862818, partial [Gautieria morchelliformis]
MPFVLLAAVPSQVEGVPSPNVSCVLVVLHVNSRHTQRITLTFTTAVSLPSTLPSFLCSSIPCALPNPLSSSSNVSSPTPIVATA